MRGAIVLAGGPSRRMGRDKPLIKVAGVPLVVRVVHAAREAAAEVVVVTKTTQVDSLRSVLPGAVALRTDAGRIQSPLVGFVAGADVLTSEYVAFLPCDLPLLSPVLLYALFTAAEGHDAAMEALEAGDRANTDLIRRLLDVVYVPVEELRTVDPELDSFVNVNTPADLKAAQRRLRSRE